jgi:predicted dehydrogenase
LDYLDYPEGRTDVSFVLDILHLSGVRSYIDASKAHHADAKQWRVYGSEGNYCVTPNDVQFESIMAGLTPLGEGDKWGIDVPEAWGVLTTSAGQEVIPAQAGRYQDFYSQFAAACRGEAELPVKPEQAKRTIEVLDAARQSAETGLPVALN